MPESSEGQGIQNGWEGPYGGWVIGTQYLFILPFEAGEEGKGKEPAAPQYQPNPVVKVEVYAIKVNVKHTDAFRASAPSKNLNMK